MSIRFLNYLFLLIQKLHLQMIQVLLNNLISTISPNSYILLNIQIPPAQFIRFSYSLAYLPVFQGCLTRGEEKTSMSRQFGLMMETCSELRDPLFRARLNQIALGSHQRVNYILVLPP